ncbi:MAG: hypothetical protein MK180_14800 [Rhodobacteraceae bacterium]|nr:hypothetical protein [Paracoccaceae bacterium]
MDASLSGNSWDQGLSLTSDKITFLHGQHDQSAPIQLIEAVVSRVGGKVQIVPQAGQALLHGHP